MLRLSPAKTPAEAAEHVASGAAAHAAAVDQDLAFPADDIDALHRSGLLLAPFPSACGGDGLALGMPAAQDLCRILRRLGAGSLPLGRLYEGHVNAVGLVTRYGTPRQLAALAQQVRHAALLGVWNTDADEPVRLVAAHGGLVLTGRKVLCSGAGFIERPLITARDEAGRLLMVTPKLRRETGADLSTWTPQGMRASATGTVDFAGIRIDSEDIVGADDDYHRQPAFSGGAWRFAAVHLGGMEALFDLCRAHLRRTGRGGDPHQAARLGQAGISVETARLWVERAALLVESHGPEADAIVAYANLARLAVERAALDLMELVNRSVGLAAFMRPNPIERISRDLTTYLRQPAPDRALTGAAAWILERTETTAELWP